MKHRQTGARAGSPVNVRNIQFPNAVEPSDSFLLAFTVRNSRSSAVPFADPDHCTAKNFRGGTAISVEVDVAGTVVSDQRCIPIDGGSHNLEFDVFAPARKGKYDLTITLKGKNSGNLFSRFEDTFRVSSRAPEPSCPTGFIRDPNTGRCVRSGRNGDDPSFPGDGDDDDQGGSKILTTVLENPVASGVAILGGTVALRTAIESTVTGE